MATASATSPRVSKPWISLGFIAEGTDCDDSHAAETAATEVCGDGIDNDCDPSFAGCPLASSPSPTR